LFLETSVAEPHNFYAVPAPGLCENFNAAPASTLLYNRSKFLKGIKVNLRTDILFTSDYVPVYEYCSKYAKKATKIFSLCHFRKTSHIENHI
jgi:hypothetical protein